MGFYLAGLIVVLVLKCLVHDKGETSLDLWKRILELPTDATILALLTVIAATTADSSGTIEPKLALASSIVMSVLSIAAFKHTAKNMNDRSGSIQWDSKLTFWIAAAVNLIFAVASTILVSMTGVFK